MKTLFRDIQVLTTGGLMLASTSCSNLLCERDNYRSGVGECAAERYVIQVSITEPRINLRDTAAMPIHVGARARDTNTVFNLAGEPDTKLAFDGKTFADVEPTPVKIGPDGQSVLVSRSPALFKPGELQAEVTLPGLPPAQSGRLHRAFWAPMPGTPEPVLPGTAGMTNPHRTGLVKGRVSVQIASPIGQPGQVLITETFEFLSKPGRWLDLYALGGDGMLGYADSADWQLTQNKLSEGADAQLVLIPGAVVIYDAVVSMATKDLAILPLKGTRQSGLSKIEPQVPADATSLAGCSEEPVILLARAGEVRVFRMDANPAQRPVTHVYSLQVNGTPVIAARDALGAAPALRSDEYFAAVFESGGKVTLLKLTKAAGVVTGVEPVQLPSELGAASITAAALADLDSDGLQDLLVAQADGTLAWSPQNPDKTFPALSALGPNVPKVPGTTSISVGDLNQDKLPDIAVATKDQGAFIFRNKP